MIVNRNDYRMVDGGGGYGVGFQLLNSSTFDPEELSFGKQLLDERRSTYGEGVVVLDCGANIGVHTLEWSTFMSGWGFVFAIEAQEAVFYALAGNIVLNNCFNARAIWAAVGMSDNTEIGVPVLNHLMPASFGSLELHESENNEDIGQPVDYSSTTPVQMITIDSMQLPRLDFIKMDIEGMELEGLAGALATIRRCKPYLMIEQIKCNREDLNAFLSREGYAVFPLGLNVVAVPKDAPIASKIKVKEEA